MGSQQKNANNNNRSGSNRQIIEAMEDYSSAELEAAARKQKRRSTTTTPTSKQQQPSPEEQKTNLCLKSLPILCSVLAFVFGMIGVLDCHLTQLNYKNDQGDYEFVYWMGYYSHSMEEDPNKSCKFGWPEDTINIPGAWLLMSMVVVWLTLGMHGIIWLLHIFRKPCKRECNIGCSLNYYIGVGLLYIVLLVVGVTGRFESAVEDGDYDDYQTEFGPAAALLIVAAFLCLCTAMLEHCLRTSDKINVYEDEETKDASEEPLCYSCVEVVGGDQPRLSMDVSEKTSSEHVA